MADVGKGRWNRICKLQVGGVGPMEKREDVAWLRAYSCPAPSSTAFYQGIRLSEAPHYTTFGKMIGDIGCNIECGRRLLRSFLLSYLQVVRASTSARATW